MKTYHIPLNKLQDLLLEIYVAGNKADKLTEQNVKNRVKQLKDEIEKIVNSHGLMYEGT